MAGNPKQKLKLLYLMEIFNCYTDENTPLSAREICEKLQLYGINAGRKSIYSDIGYLQEYGMDIICTRSPKSGYFLAERKFELPELQLLINAVQAACFITPKKTHILIEKLQALCSVSQAQQLNVQYFFGNSTKCQNEEIYYNIDEISFAIINKKKITLQYLKRNIEHGRISRIVKQSMLISPYAMMWSNDHYYLVGNNQEYDNLVHLRIDCIKKVKVTKYAARPFEEVCEYKEIFDAADYSKKIFNMLGGELRTVELRCKNCIIESVMDRFGMDIPIISGGKDSFIIKVKVIVGEGLISWLLQYTTNIEVLGPQNLRRTVAKRITELSEIYSRPPVGYRFL